MNFLSFKNTGFALILLGAILIGVTGVDTLLKTRGGQPMSTFESLSGRVVRTQEIMPIRWLTGVGTLLIICGISFSVIKKEK